MKKVAASLVVALLLALLLPAAALAQSPPPSNYPPPPPSISIDNTNPSVGDRIVVSGQGWCPSSTVDIYLDGTKVGSATVGQDGTFSTTIVIPPGTSPGPHTITVKGQNFTCDANQVQSRRIVVQGETVTKGGNLPFTGSNISVGMLILVALVIVGGVSLLAGRRKDASAKE